MWALLSVERFEDLEKEVENVEIKIDSAQDVPA
jgi:hypothetical protein